MESLGYKQKNKMVYQMIENMKQKSIDFDQFLDMVRGDAHEGRTGRKRSVGSGDNHAGRGWGDVCASSMLSWGVRAREC